jgi:acylphosphatase
MPKRLILTGRVQGVGCRNYCQSYAEELGIRGSATNRADGSVEVLLNTNDDALTRRFTECLRSNPKGFLFFGKISDIKTGDYNGGFGGDYVF